jgi:hypothetical protein
MRAVKTSPTRCTLHVILVIALGLLILGLWSVTPGTEPTNLTKVLACADALAVLALLWRTRSY